MKILLLLCLTLALQVTAQDENSLRRYFEGGSVRLKTDMPAASSGIDINWHRDPPLDFRVYSQRIKSFGISIHSGDIVTVTTLRVKGKNIEFQLNGGGYGTAHDDKGDVPTPTVPKSNREIDLEKQISHETDRDRRDRLKSELARLQDQRQHEERRLQDQAKQEEFARKRDIEVKRLAAGSRFNIWFPDDRLKESVPSPQELMQILGEWVDFSGINSGAMPPPQPTMTMNAPQQQPMQQQMPPSAARLARGISLDQVHGLLGVPSSSREARQGDLTTVSESWETADDRTEVLFVNGTVVKYTVVSK
jgi:hypothetical protein